MNNPNEPDKFDWTPVLNGLFIVGVIALCILALPFVIVFGIIYIYCKY